MKGSGELLSVNNCSLLLSIQAAVLELIIKTTVAEKISNPALIRAELL